jgi:hypothetical protein
MIGPLFDQIAAAAGVNAGKARTILMTVAFALCIIVVGLRLLTR